MPLTKPCQPAVLEPELEVTHIGVVQHYGLTGNGSANPTYSQGFPSEHEALKWVETFVYEAHDHTPFVQRVYENLGPMDGDHRTGNETKCVIFVRSSAGPTWGMVASC